MTWHMKMLRMRLLVVVAAFFAINILSHELCQSWLIMVCVIAYRKIQMQLTNNLQQRHLSNTAKLSVMGVTTAERRHPQFVQELENTCKQVQQLQHCIYLPRPLPRLPRPPLAFAVPDPRPRVLLLDPWEYSHSQQNNNHIMIVIYRKTSLNWIAM